MQEDCAVAVWRIAARTTKNLADLPSSHPPCESLGTRHERAGWQQPEACRAARPRDGTRASASRRRLRIHHIWRARPAILGFGFVFAAVRCSRTQVRSAAGPRESLAKTQACRAGRLRCLELGLAAEELGRQVLAELGRQQALDRRLFHDTLAFIVLELDAHSGRV